MPATPKQNSTYSLNINFLVKSIYLNYVPLGQYPRGSDITKTLLKGKISDVYKVAPGALYICFSAVAATWRNIADLI